MNDDSLVDANPAEPLAFQRLDRVVPACPTGYRAAGFELTSRGDRVPGVLLLPDAASGPSPLLIAQHGCAGRAETEAVAIADWLGAGCAVACIDLPLHGHRASAKLTERFRGITATRSPRSDLETRLFEDLLRQAVVDLRRTLRGLAGLPEIDAKRIAFLGRDLGSLAGIPFCASEPDVRAAVLIDAASGTAPEALDPVGWIRGMAGRPLLFVNAEQAAHHSRAEAETLHGAAPEPKRVHWVATSEAPLPDVALPLLRGEAVG